VSATMTGTDFIAPIRTELEDFERRLHDTVRADLGPVAEAMEQILEAGGQSPDHPVHPAIPETRYLKAFFCRVTRE